MTCPSEVAEIIAEILKLGLLRIRAFGWEGDAPRCASEADHLHNLPTLLINYAPELLAYYWDTERVCFRERSSPADLVAFEPLWERLRFHVDACGAPVLT